MNDGFRHTVIYFILSMAQTQLYGYRIIISSFYLKKIDRFPPMFIRLCDKTGVDCICVYSLNRIIKNNV